MTASDGLSTMEGLAAETYVIGSGQGAVRSADLAAGIFETLKCLLETKMLAGHIANGRD